MTQLNKLYSQWLDTQPLSADDEQRLNRKFMLDFGRIVKDLCLCVDIAEPENEKFCVVDTVKFGSEGFDFGVYRLGRGVGRTVVKEVQDFIGVLIEGCGYGVERLEAGLGDAIIAAGKVQSCGTFYRAFVEYGSEVLR